MKKIIFLGLCLFWPFSVYALERMDVSNLLVDVTLKDDGRMSVKELFLVSGDYETFTRRLTYKTSSYSYNTPPLLLKDVIYNGRDLTVLNVSYLNLEDEITFDTFDEDFTKFTKNYYKEDAKDKDYVEFSVQDGKDITLYYDSENERTAFLIEYEITDVVVKHLDCEEIYWAFLKNFDKDMASFSLRLHFPKSIHLETFKSYLHGDISGKTIMLDTKTIQTNFNKVRRNTEILTRFVFDSDTVLTVPSNKQSGLNRYQDILHLEDEEVKKETKEAETKDKIGQIMTRFCKSYLIVLFALWFLFLLRYKKSFSKKEESAMNAPYPVAILTTFLYGKTNKSAFCTSLLELYKKGNIGYTKNTLTIKDKENLNYTEEMIIEFLFDKVGKENHVSLNELYKYMTNEKTAGSFKKFYNSWSLCVSKETDKCSFYEKNGLPIICSIFAVLIILFVLFASVYFKVSYLLPWLSFLITLLFVFFCFSFSPKTKEGRYLSKKLQKVRETLEGDLTSLNKSEYLDYYLYSYFWNKNEDVYEKMMLLLKRDGLKNREIISSLKKMKQIALKIQYAYLLNDEITN